MEDSRRVVAVSEDSIDAFDRKFLEVGDDAVWSVTSAKHGSGVAQLRDNDSNTFWQSDGNLPHHITIELPRLTPIYVVAVLLNSTNDESYTPRKISIHAGTHDNDYTEVGSLEVEQPNGWIVVHLLDEAASEISNGVYVNVQRVWCRHVRVTVLENHQNGRDTHIRGLRIYSPKFRLPCTTPAFTSHFTLR